MPIIRKTPYSDRAGQGVRSPKYKMRVYTTGGNFMEKEYQNIDKMEQFRRYYKEKGYRTRRI